MRRGRGEGEGQGGAGESIENIDYWLGHQFSHSQSHGTAPTLPAQLSLSLSTALEFLYLCLRFVISVQQNVHGEQIRI